MATKPLRSAPKISVQIWRPINDKLTEKIEAACLRRDAYLNKVLEVELPELDQEVTIANSPAAQKYVAERLDTLDRKLVSLTLDPALIERLNDICRRKNIVRDAFFNRLFLLLAGSPKIIDTLYFDDPAWRAEILEQFRGDSAFVDGVFFPLDQEINPLWPMREALRLEADRIGVDSWLNPEGELISVRKSLAGVPMPVSSIYTVLFPEDKFKDVDLRGLNVYYPDSWIPGSEAQKRERSSLDDLLVPLGKPSSS
ncbi:hypothetical protein [Rubrivivax albus]|uniref:Uncharacterized protein n=1 Tax=Rubrivivax albus TaxID=2499835 RepID=A0A3S2UKR7_9BURK|nr:hypothetical protein [Rubrivivax albus]RVT47676.1 hypothetical protein ENE75_23950 [Rubrivivax albus]